MNNEQKAFIFREFLKKQNSLKKYLANLERQKSKDGAHFLPHNVISEWINYAFTWSETPQKHEYWRVQCENWRILCKKFFKD